ncbi:TPA: type II toxin-antitoxin system RelE/ParE family toxin [Streptococcus pneumoniae]
MYKLVPTRRFIKQLKKLDRYTQKLITNYLQTKFKLSNNSIESKESKNLKKKWLFADYYDTTIILLALISVILVLLGFAEMTDLDNPPYSIIDLVIWGVFCN